MRDVRRVAAFGATAALAAALTACTASPPPSAPSPSSSTTAAAAPSSTVTATPAPGGVTAKGDAFGSACPQLPQGDTPGSLAAMTAQPVAAAASSTPLLTTLAAAVGKVPGLAPSLDAAQGITVFAPDNAAFTELQKAIGETAYAALLADPDRLDTLLTGHVVGARYDAVGLAAAGKLTALSGAEVTIGGTAAQPTVSIGGGAPAKVLCGNMPTANATVFLIDKVLLPKS